MSLSNVFGPPRGWPASGWPRGLAGRLLAWLRRSAWEERDRWVLWLPVAMGAGIGIYFGLSREPPWWPALTVLAAASGLAWLARRWPAACVLAIGVAATAGGFALAKWRTELTAAPVLQREIGPAPVEGRVVEIQPVIGGVRLILEEVVLARDPGGPVPARVRVVLRRGGESVAIGDRVRVMAVLAPPAAPAAPGAYDFQRTAWFSGLGAVGYALGAPEVILREPPRGWLALAALRDGVTRRIMAALPGEEGAMAAALLTGEQKAVPNETMEAMRDSGLAHLLSISGLHMTLVAAFLMLVVRGALALVPALALRYPIKKWAAGIALLGAFAYLLLAGAPIPAQRAFVMAAVVLLAIVVDRTAISMRSVAWATMIVLALMPEAMLGASFQMSFAAVIALIAAWEWWSAWRQRRMGRAPDGPPGLAGRAALYLGGALATTLVASLATGVFGLYHFNRVALLGVLANLLAVPVTSILVMPAGVAGLLLMPLGLEELALVPMGWGISLVIEIARTGASWPGAATVLPAMPDIALPLVALGGLWLCLWRRGWRLLGLAPILAALLLSLQHRQPDVLVSADGRLFGVMARDGTLMLSRPRSGMTGETWTRRAGEAAALAWPSGGASADGDLRCDSAGCLLVRHGSSVLLAFGVEALAEDCGRVDVILAAVPAGRHCARRERLVDRFSLWREGAHALWLLPDGGVRILSARQWRGERPWVIRPQERERARAGREDAPAGMAEDEDG